MSVTAAQWGGLLRASAHPAGVREGTWQAPGVYFGAVGADGSPLVGEDGEPVDGDPSSAVVLAHVAGLSKGDRVLCAVSDRGVAYVLGKA